MREWKTCNEGGMNGLNINDAFCVVAGVFSFTVWTNQPVFHNDRNLKQRRIDFLPPVHLHVLQSGSEEPWFAVGFDTSESGSSDRWFGHWTLDRPLNSLHVPLWNKSKCSNNLSSAGIMYFLFSFLFRLLGNCKYYKYLITLTSICLLSTAGNVVLYILFTGICYAFCWDGTTVAWILFLSR